MSRMVALILQTQALTWAQRLCCQMPVWIADTALHAPLKTRPRESAARQLTWFFLVPPESLEDAAYRIAWDIDQHHGECSQTPGYDTLWFVGLPYRAARLGEIEALGFRRLEPACDGFVAIK